MFLPVSSSTLFCWHGLNSLQLPNGLFYFLLHRPAARISLPFQILVHKFNCTDPGIYNWEIQHHSLVCRYGLADNLYILAHELPDTMPVIKKQAINELLTKRLECFHSRGQQLLKFIGKKDSFRILKKKGLCTEPPSPQGRKFRFFLRGGGICTRANVQRQGARILGTEKNQINTFISLH